MLGGGGGGCRGPASVKILPGVPGRPLGTGAITFEAERRLLALSCCFLLSAATALLPGRSMISGEEECDFIPWLVLGALSLAAGLKTPSLLRLTTV